MAILPFRGILVWCRRRFDALAAIDNDVLAFELVVMATAVVVGLDLFFTGSAVGEKFTVSYALPALLAALIRNVYLRLACIIAMAMLAWIDLRLLEPVGMPVNAALRLVAYLAMVSVVRGLLRIRRDLLHESRQKHDELTGIIKQTIGILSYIEGERGSGNDGHLDRVALNTRTLACALTDPGCTRTEAYYAGLLHDIGKITLSPDRRAISHQSIKRHAHAGHQILRAIHPSLRRIALAAYHHHERYDGRGCPCRLKGADIPLLARVVTICNVFDRLTSCRGGLRSLDPNAAVRHLINYAGSQFDPELVIQFVALYRQGCIMVDRSAVECGFGVAKGRKGRKARSGADGGKPGVGAATPAASGDES